MSSLGLLILSPPMTSFLGRIEGTLSFSFCFRRDSMSFLVWRVMEWGRWEGGIERFSPLITINLYKFDRNDVVTILEVGTD